MPLLLPIAACAAADPGPTGKVNVAALEARTTAQVLDDWVKQVAQLSLGTAVRQQVVGREPAAGTVEYLAAMLNAVPRDEALLGALQPAAFALMDTLTSFEIQHMHAALLDAAGQALLKKLHSDYQQRYKYRGKV